MAGAFKRTRRGITAKLDDTERSLLAHLFVETYELLGTETSAGPADDDPLAALVGIGTAVDAPSDPALHRLLPDAHREDPEAAADFRRYTEHSLRERKRDNLEKARLSLGRDGALVLSDAEAQAWLVALTDVRLVLAERLEVRTDEDHERLVDEVFGAWEDSGAEEEPPVDDPRAPLLMVYDFLTWLQETLVEALLPSR